MTRLCSRTSELRCNEVQDRRRDASLVPAARSGRCRHGVGATKRSVARFARAEAALQHCRRETPGRVRHKARKGNHAAMALRRAAANRARRNLVVSHRSQNGRFRVGSLWQGLDAVLREAGEVTPRTRPGSRASAHAVRQGDSTSSLPSRQHRRINSAESPCLIAIVNPHVSIANFSLYLPSIGPSWG